VSTKLWKSTESRSLGGVKCLYTQFLTNTAICTGRTTSINLRLDRKFHKPLWFTQAWCLKAHDSLNTFTPKGQKLLSAKRNMFAAARQRIRKPPAIRKNMLRRHRKVKAQTAKHASELHEQLVSHLTGPQLLRLKAEFTRLDEEGLGFLHAKDLLPVRTS
jgi:hypothetical protein